MILILTHYRNNMCVCSEQFFLVADQTLMGHIVGIKYNETITTINYFLILFTIQTRTNCNFQFIKCICNPVFPSSQYHHHRRESLTSRSSELRLSATAAGRSLQGRPAPGHPAPVYSCTAVQSVQAGVHSAGRD